MAAPGGTGPVGPFPAGTDTPEQQDEYDKLRRRVLWTLPYGLYVLGSRAGDRRNGMTMNWVSQVSFDPKLLGVGIEKGALTHELVSAERRVRAQHRVVGRTARSSGSSPSRSRSTRPPRRSTASRSTTA